MSPLTSQLLLRLPRIALIFAGILFLAGCSNYQLGAPAGKDAPHRLFVPVVENSSYAPQITALLTGEIKEELISDGFATLVPSDVTAQAVLEVEVLDYTTREIATRSDDTGRGLAFESRLVARATLRSPGGARIWFENETFEAVTTVVSVPNLPDARTQAMPLLAEDLARQIANRVSDPLF